MKIAQINMTHHGSTGRIMFQIADTARKAGHEVRTYAPKIFSRHKKSSSLSISDHFTWGTTAESALHYYAGTILGGNGLFSHRGTKTLLRELDRFAPDVIHLHNLHNFCINLPMLFSYIKKKNIRVVWTLHDCWSFTGHCPHFIIAKCDKWKTGCHHCPQPQVYPKMYLDTSKMMYAKKKRWFTGVDDMTLVAPSAWLTDLVKQSFLKNYPTKVINNGIDLSVFRPVEGDFREKYGLEDKKIILGVSFSWGYQKGLDVFIELSKRLPDDYKIVLVGTSDAIDAQLPKNILSIHSTEDQTELAQIYSAADIFVNPTREEVQGLVNIEALACGTPGVSFDSGGSPECYDKTCGSVVKCGDIVALEKEIIRICTEKPYARETCQKRAKNFDMYDKFEEYIKLYQEVIR